MNVSQLVTHKKAIASIWILFILFPNNGLLPLDLYRFFEKPTQPTDDVQLVADSLPQIRRQSSSTLTTIFIMLTIFRPMVLFGIFLRPAMFSKHRKETASQKPSYLQACLKRNGFHTQSRYLSCISGSITTAN